MQKFSVAVAGALLLLSCFMINKLTASMLIDPSVIKSRALLGQKTELLGIGAPYFLAIKNTGTKTSRYRVEIVTCREYGCSPYFGYEDIPDIKWIKIASPDVEIPPGAISEFRGVTAKILRARKYRGKRYQAVVKVTKPSGQGESVNLEVVIPLWIEVVDAKKGR